jgi:hypothetical protein
MTHDEEEPLPPIAPDQIVTDAIHRRELQTQHGLPVVSAHAAMGHQRDGRHEVHEKIQLSMGEALRKVDTHNTPYGVTAFGNPESHMGHPAHHSHSSVRLL